MQRELRLRQRYLLCQRLPRLLLHHNADLQLLLQLAQEVRAVGLQEVAGDPRGADTDGPGADGCHEASQRLLRRAACHGVAVDLRGTDAERSAEDAARQPSNGSPERHPP